MEKTKIKISPILQSVLKCSKCGDTFELDENRWHVRDGIWCEFCCEKHLTDHEFLCLEKCNDKLSYDNIQTN